MPLEYVRRTVIDIKDCSTIEHIASSDSIGGTNTFDVDVLFEPVYLGRMDIVKEKIQQVGPLLDELDIDLWLLFVRETPMLTDPVMSLVVGFHATWQSFFVYTRQGEAIALIGNFDEADYRRSGRFTEVLPYTVGVREDLRSLLKRLAPKTIGINYSIDNPAADGLTHGMYLLLKEYLEDTPFADRIVSAEEVSNKVRARKTPQEVGRLEIAARMANDAWSEAMGRIKIGQSEIEVARIIDETVVRAGGQPSFETIVNAGDKTEPGHSHPTEAKLEPGDLLHIDFGARVDGYCSDIQRLLYFRRPRETQPPTELLDAFATVSSIIEETAQLVKPGMKGYEVDARAREILSENGYPEYQHALGHQLGRSVHDGGAILGPKWERYGRTPTIPIDANNIFTLELEIILPGIGCVGLEEDVCVTENGGRFLCPPQRELYVK